MTRITVFLMVLGSLMWGWIRPTHAIIPVEEVGLNLILNDIQAVQAIAMVLNQIIELTGLDELALGDGTFEADLRTMQQLVAETRGLSWELASLQAQMTRLFDPMGAPASSSELRLRQAEMRQVVYESYAYALQTQTLLRTVLRTVEHIIRLYGTVGALIGNLQGMQTAAQGLNKLQQVMAEQTVQIAAYNRGQTVERLQEPVTIESLHRINAELLRDHPR